MGQEEVRWRVELHTHTEWSKDCMVRFDTIQQICERQGIDRIAITDHNTADGALRMARLAPERVIVGEEIMTTQGELLGYFLHESIPPGLTPKETIRRLRDQGALISVSHPFDRLRKGAWEEADLRHIIDQVDAIEVFNARCLFPADNQRAAAFAAEHGVCGTAGSDAHSHVEYGRALMALPPFHDAAGLLAALRVGEVIPGYSPAWVHMSSKTAKWSKKLGLRQRLWERG